MKYISIPNWNKFQHYKNRNPIWIKCYLNELEHGEEFLSLSDSDKWLFWSLVILAAHKNNWIACGEQFLIHSLTLENTRNLMRRIRKLAVLKLIAINNASKKDKVCYQVASTEKSREDKKRIDTTTLLNKFKMNDD